MRSIYSDRADSVRCEETWHNYPDCQLAVTGLSLNTGLNDVIICYILCLSRVPASAVPDNNNNIGLFYGDHS